MIPIPNYIKPIQSGIVTHTSLFLYHTSGHVDQHQRGRLPGLIERIGLVLAQAAAVRRRLHWLTCNDIEIDPDSNSMKQNSVFSFRRLCDYADFNPVRESEVMQTQSKAAAATTTMSSSPSSSSSELVMSMILRPD